MEANNLIQVSKGELIKSPSVCHGDKMYRLNQPIDNHPNGVILSPGFQQPHHKTNGIESHFPSGTARIVRVLKGADAPVSPIGMSSTQAHNPLLRASYCSTRRFAKGPCTGYSHQDAPIVGYCDTYLESFF